MDVKRVVTDLAGRLSTALQAASSPAGPIIGRVPSKYWPGILAGASVALVLAALSVVCSFGSVEEPLGEPGLANYYLGCSQCGHVWAVNLQRTQRSGSSATLCPQCSRHAGRPAVKCNHPDCGKWYAPFSAAKKRVSLQCPECNRGPL